MAIIQVKSLSKSYEYYRKEAGLKGSLKALFNRQTLFAEAVKEISFNVKEGELVGFLGPNGAGKTTTLKLLSGIIFPSSGEVKVLGYTPSRREKGYQKQFAIVMGQKNQLLLDLPARETFALRGAIYEIPQKQFKRNLEELVEVLGAEDILDIPVRKLSLGQRMKCELISALLHKPKVLLLDEPTIGLDVIAQKNIRDFIKKYNRLHKTTILVTSHYMEDIRQLCKRVIIINLGQVIYDGSLEELIKKYATHKNLKVIFSQKGVTKSMLRKFGEVIDFSDYNGTVRVDNYQSKQKAIDLLSSELPIQDVLISEDSVDDIIRKIFAENKNTK